MKRFAGILTVAMILWGAYSQAAPRCAVAAQDQSQIIETRFGEIELTSETAIQLMNDQVAIAKALELKGTEKKDALMSYFEQKKPSRVNMALTVANYTMGLAIGAHLAMDFAHEPVRLATTAALIPPTLFITDFVSGLYHKFLDSYASEKNPFWGPATRAFRIHHEFSSNLNELSYMNNVAAFSKLMAPLYVATAIAQPHMAPEAASMALVSLMLFTNGTEIHRQAHLSQPKGWVKRLQKFKILLSRKDHMKHHKAPTDSDFGIINGWSNGISAPLWNRLDLIMWKARRKMPSNWIQNPKSIPPAVVAELMADLQSIPQEFIVAMSDPNQSTPELDDLVALWIDRHGALESIGDRP